MVEETSSSEFAVQKIPLKKKSHFKCKNTSREKSDFETATLPEWIYIAGDDCRRGGESIDEGHPTLVGLTGFPFARSCWPIWRPRRGCHRIVRIFAASRRGEILGDVTGSVE